MDAGERRRRLAGIQGQVREHDIARWIDSQLADLDAVGHSSGTRLPV
jgi:trehalose-6-phosphate synthase